MKMKRLTTDQRKQVIEDSKTMSDKELLNKYHISKPTLWRIKKSSQITTETKKEEEGSETQLETDSESVSSASTADSIDMKSDNEKPKEHYAPPVKFLKARKITPTPAKRETPMSIPEEPKAVISGDDNKAKHQSLILQIRNYIECFPDKLRKIYIDKDSFNKEIFFKSNEDLEVILESIRVELSVLTHLNTFMNVFYVIVTGIEKSSTFLGVDMTGLTKDVESDPGFNENIKMLACEIPFNLSPKKKILFLLSRACLLRYEMNRLKVSHLNHTGIKVDELKEKYKDI